MKRLRRCLYCLFLYFIGGQALADDFYLGPAGLEAERRVKQDFQRAGIDYPPERAQLIGLKETRRLELWVWSDRAWRHVRDYPIFAASGGAGPKLLEGDKQVPEGFYRVESLNPNSHFHLSLKLDFPNAYDWLNATKEGRKNPGSNIFIHGSAWSAGCLAMGNRVVEELYVLLARIGVDKAHVLIAPRDFRNPDKAPTGKEPDWVADLYAYLNNHLKRFPIAQKTPLCAPGCAQKLTYRRELSDVED